MTNLSRCSLEGKHGVWRAVDLVDVLLRRDEDVASVWGEDLKGLSFCLHPLDSRSRK